MSIITFKMKVNMLATLILSPILLGSIAQASDPTIEVTLTRTFNILPDRKIAIQPPDVAPSKVVKSRKKNRKLKNSLLIGLLTPITIFFLAAMKLAKRKKILLL
ncbi:hypothetical protein B0J14DRAFT_693177 [Halenospora varia]|nr:hypothetical protein B0J14DRAFT_693177 [Halenospora varia]